MLDKARSSFSLQIHIGRLDIDGIKQSMMESISNIQKEVYWA